MSSGRTVSHHMLRRTARARKAKIRRAQRFAAAGIEFARAELRELGIDATTGLVVESTLRGPFGWRVVTR